jgi:CRISPR/Cas system-associated endonuclease Cas1
MVADPGQIAGCQTILHRNYVAVPETVLQDLRHDSLRAGQAPSLAELLGIEGTAARRYVAEYSGMLKSDSRFSPFAFESRNRRLPGDTVNALLSLAYALLARDWVVTVQARGPDPYLGFSHQSRSGRPALALDLVEEFRPLIGGSVVLTAVNICGHLTHLAVVDREADRQASLSAGCKKSRTGGKGVGSLLCHQPPGSLAACSPSRPLSVAALRNNDSRPLFHHWPVVS